MADGVAAQDLATKTVDIGEVPHQKGGPFFHSQHAKVVPELFP